MSAGKVESGSSPLFHPAKVGVVGGSGYTGLELVRLLQKHPFAQLRIGFSTNAEFKFADYLPNRAALGIPVAPVSELPQWVHELDTVFLATPADASMKLAPQLLEAGVNVIDLSGAFRLTAGDAETRQKTYQSFYKMSHTAPDLLDVAEYGLKPWNKNISKRMLTTGRKPMLVANPGCYATSVLMALLPLLTRNLIDPESVVIDAKSGTSGAGRKASESLLFTEVEGECLPYRIGKHQHLPEIQLFSKVFGGAEVQPFFATHLLPIRRGILTSLYAKLKTPLTANDLLPAFSADYSDYGLVEWGTLNAGTEREEAYKLSLKRVVGTGLTRIHFHIDANRIYLFSIIDNLVKGAAGQAIENFNALHGAPLATGLDKLEGVL